SRIMKSKEGFVQAYNAQAAVDAEAQIIVAHELTQCGSDQGQLVPLVEAIENNLIVSHEVIHFFGMRYRVPVVTHWAGTVIAVNVGGAVIPTLMSVYLLIKRELWVKGLIATAVVALVIHWMADPVPGLGIAVPIFMPVLVTAIV